MEAALLADLRQKGIAFRRYEVAASQVEAMRMRLLVAPDDNGIAAVCPRNRPKGAADQEIVTRQADKHLDEALFRKGGVRSTSKS